MAHVQLLAVSEDPQHGAAEGVSQVELDLDAGHERELPRGEQLLVAHLRAQQNKAAEELVVCVDAEVHLVLVRQAAVHHAAVACLGVVGLVHLEAADEEARDQGALDHRQGHAHVLHLHGLGLAHRHVLALQHERAVLVWIVGGLCPHLVLSSCGGLNSLSSL